MDLEIREASSPFSINNIHAILYLPRKGIYLPSKRCPNPCIKGPGTPPQNTPHTAPQSPENHFQDPSCYIVTTNTSHSPTNKPLSRKQMPATIQVAAKRFQLPWRARCCSNVASLPQHPSDRAYCASKYSRTSPGCGKVDFYKTSSSSHPGAYSLKASCYDHINLGVVCFTCFKSPKRCSHLHQAEITKDSYHAPYPP